MDLSVKLARAGKDLRRRAAPECHRAEAQAAGGREGRERAREHGPSKTAASRRVSITRSEHPWEF